MTATHEDFMIALERADPIVRDALVAARQENGQLAQQLMASETALRRETERCNSLTERDGVKYGKLMEQLVTCRVNRALLKIAHRQEREAHNTTRHEMEGWRDLYHKELTDPLLGRR